MRLPHRSTSRSACSTSNSNIQGDSTPASARLKEASIAFLPCMSSSSKRRLGSARIRRSISITASDTAAEWPTAAAERAALERSSSVASIKVAGAPRTSRAV